MKCGWRRSVSSNEWTSTPVHVRPVVNGSFALGSGQQKPRLTWQGPCPATAARYRARPRRWNARAPARYAVGRRSSPCCVAGPCPAGLGFGMKGMFWWGLGSAERWHNQRSSQVTAATKQGGAFAALNPACPAPRRAGNQCNTEVAKRRLTQRKAAHLLHQTQPFPPRDALGSQHKHRSSQAAPRTCDGSGRRQIAMLFFGAEKRAHVAQGNKQGRSQYSAVCRGLCPPPRKMAIERDLTKGSVSRFLVTLF